MITRLQDFTLQRYLQEPTVENRNEVVNAYQYLCVRGARKFFRGTLDRADLVQVGVIGLIKAADRYRAEIGTPFEAYAWLMVVGELMHYVRDYEALVRLPRSMRSYDRRYREACSALWERHAREPNARELATEMGTSVEIVDEVRRLRGGMHQSLQSVPSAPATGTWTSGEGLSLEDRLALEVAIRGLRTRERTVVKGVFLEGLTQREIGARLGVSQRHVSRILSGAMKKIAAALR